MARREGGSKDNDDVDEAMREWHKRGVGTRLYDAFTVAGLRVDAIEPGRALFSFTVPPRLTVCTYGLTISTINPCSFIKKE